MTAVISFILPNPQKRRGMSWRATCIYSFVILAADIMINCNIHASAIASCAYASRISAKAKSTTLQTAGFSTDAKKSPGIYPRPFCSSSGEMFLAARF
jgi:hypothetical protein